jgi:hypothetical protein
MPDAQGREVDYTVMRVGSDDALALALPTKVEVEVTHDDTMPHQEVVALAYRKLLTVIVRETQAEYLAWRQRLIDEQRESTNL